MAVPQNSIFKKPGKLHWVKIDFEVKIQCCKKVGKSEWVKIFECKMFEVKSGKSVKVKINPYFIIHRHASKHGLPNASRKLMKEVIALLKLHYQEVHDVTMVEDDIDEQLPGGGKAISKKKQTSSPLKGSSPYSIVVPQSPLPITPSFKADASSQQLLHSMAYSNTLVKPPSTNNITSVLDNLPISLPTQTAVALTAEKPKEPGIDSTSLCSSRVLARSKGELASFGTSLLRPEAAAHKVHNSSRKPKKVVCEELWYVRIIIPFLLNVLY